MDIFAHALWTNAMYTSIAKTRNQKKTKILGMVFGILPDLISFSPFFMAWFYMLLTGSASLSRPDFEHGTIMDYALASYNYTHSFVIWAAILCLICIIIKKIPWFMLGWGLHIAIDIFSHTDQFFATPFLFPISSFKVSVISWAHPVFMLVNYSLLLVLYVWVIPRIKVSIQQEK